MSFAATWMDLRIIILSEVSQTERQTSYDIAYMQNLKKKKKIQTDIFTKINGLPNIESKLMVTKGERGREG